MRDQFKSIKTIENFHLVYFLCMYIKILKQNQLIIATERITDKTILILLFYINNTKHLNNYVATIQNLSITLMYCKIYILDYLHRMTLLLFADTIVHSN